MTARRGAMELLCSLGNDAGDGGPLRVVGGLEGLATEDDREGGYQGGGFPELEEVGLVGWAPAKLALDLEEGLEDQEPARFEQVHDGGHSGPIKIVEHQDGIVLAEIRPGLLKVGLDPFDRQAAAGSFGLGFREATGVAIHSDDRRTALCCGNRVATVTAGEIENPSPSGNQRGMGRKPIAGTLLKPEIRSWRVDRQKMNPSARATIWDLSGQSLDLLVLGGGITGAGIAREAALRGLKVALIDRYDFAWGTSSRSSRLIHGGLRYLEHRRFRLVGESLAERAVLLKTAPHLVRSLAFLFPSFRGDRVPRWKLELGLAAYDVLAWRGNVRRHRPLSKRSVLDHEPLLKEKGLVGGALYWDAQCDDARLTLGAVRAAAHHGALVANYVCATAFDIEDGRIRGTTVEDQLTGAQATVRSRVVVNATGPWVDRVRQLEDDSAKPLLRPSRGAHVMVPRSRIGHHHAITFLSPIDGRVMFVLPWGDRSYVGTTETDSEDAPDHVAATEADMLYLIRSVNAVFPSARLAMEDVSVSWAGLRPLLNTDSASNPGDRSREHAIVTGPNGLVTIAGGKLTTFRRMASDVVDQVRAILDARPVARSDPMKSRSATEPLPGGDAYRIEDLFARGVARGLSEPTVAHLVGQYGSETMAIYSLVSEWPELKEPIHPLHGAIGAQVIHAVRHEYARRLDDVLARRLSLTHETRDAGLDAAESVARLMGRELGWDDERRQQEVDRYRDWVRAIPMGRTLSSR